MDVKKEHLLSIEALDLAGVFEGMDEAQYLKYCRGLDKLVDDLPALEEELNQHSFGDGDKKLLADDLRKTKELLDRIKANKLAARCAELAESMDELSGAATAAQVNDLVAALTALSIEIQMASNKKSENDSEEKPQPSPQEPQEQSESEEKEDNSEITILAVDDVSLLLNTLKAVILGGGYKFVGVTSGVAAMRYLAEHKPHLFLLDIDMPNMDGYQLATKIREAGHTAPIIFLTGNAQKQYVLKAIQTGADDFIVKPVNKEMILEKIKKFVRTDKK